MGSSMLAEKFLDVYRSVGFHFTENAGDLEVELEGHKFKVEIDPAWRSSIDAYYKAKQYTFNEERRMLIAYKAIEIGLIKIDPYTSPRPEHEFSDEKGNLVRINKASNEYCIALLTSNGSAARPIEIIKRRLLRRAEIRKPNKDGYIRILRFEDLLYVPTTATYSVPRKIASEQLVDRGIKGIKSSLFSLAFSVGECWELRERIPQIKSTARKALEDKPNYTIPKSIYSDDLVTFYKVARSSIFPAQEFLSYYHVIEFHFLRVSDEILHTSIKSLINSPIFSSSYQNVNKLISTIKKNDHSSDETEMLKAVLKKYVDEDDLISHISLIEKEEGKAVYTDTKKKVFGEPAAIRLEKGHALGTTAKAIKQIRNALVHSSDKYNREDCFMPFSESEAVVVNYIPVIKFLAEKIIFCTVD